MPIFPGKPSKAKLVAALMASDQGLIEKTLSLLEPTYGPVELSSAVFPFTYSDYYKKEMGEGLLKVYCSFRKLIEPDEIVGLKLAAIECEKNFVRSVSRSVNIDPGYLDRMRVVLATTKDCSHRIYLGQGIYGDIELMYRSGSFVSLEWTYPDYRAALAIEFFNKVRNVYLADLREASQKAQE
jgi:hypothetical protein